MSISVPLSSLTPNELRVLANFRTELAEALDEAIAEGNDSGGSFDVINVKTDHGAVGDGVTNDSTAFAAAFAEGSSTGRIVYIPPGEYKFGTGLTSVAGDLHVIGRNATISWDGTAFNAIALATDASRITFEGVRFFVPGELLEADGNIFNALHCPSGNADITLRDCTFEWCRPTQFGGNSNMHVGRMLVLGCKILNAILALNAPSNSRITGCYFMNDATLDPNNAALYIFGEAENVIITDNFFKNVTGPSIKFNNAAARWEHKRCGLIANNFFENGDSYGIWIGSDADVTVSGFVVEGNVFRNPKNAIHLHNVSDVAVVGNSITWDWECTGAAGSVTSGIDISSGAGVGSQSPGRNIVVTGNTMRQLHPFIGKIAFTAVPVDGNTITVGAVTYTWRNSPSLSTDIQVQANTANATTAVVSKLQGRATAAMNVVLRGPEDCFYETTASLSANPTVVIASDATFTLSAVGASMTITAAVDKRIASACIHANETQNIRITGNTFENFNWLAVHKSVEPVVANNSFIDCILDLRGNNRSKCEYNTITWRRARAAPRSGQSTVQQINVSDAWPIVRGNGLIRNQNYSCVQMLGASGVVPVSSGKAYADIYYGSEITSDTGVESTAFRWSDGDIVTVGSPTTFTYSFTFKRTAPGANEFNSIASLRALIDAVEAGAFVTSFVPTVTFNDNIWIRVTFNTIGVAGNTGWIRTTTKSQTCGQLLLDPNASNPENTRTLLRGGNAAATSTKTWVWTQLANVNVPPRVQGVDAASQALAPVVYSADIVPGVGFYITHNAASGAGTESFAWYLEAP